MKIKHTKLIHYTLPMLQQWHSKRQELSTRTGWLLALEDSEGIKGYGDCAPLPSHGTETATEALAALESRLPLLADISASDALEKLSDSNTPPAVRCAIETALVDLMAKQQVAPLHKWLNQKSNSMVMVNTAIGTLDESTSERIANAIEQGYSVLKLKVGLSEPKNELDRLNQLCSNLPESIQLRLDANQAWDIATAKSFLNSISQLPIESLEEPLAQPDLNNFKQLQDGTDITLALDETVTKLDSEALHQHKHIRRLILKPMVLGGVLPALQLGKQARDMGIETVVTTTIDSAAGVWAATQLAAALDPEAELCHGLATSEWLQHDIGRGPNIKNGSITIPHTPGLGFVPFD